MGQWGQKSAGLFPWRPPLGHYHSKCILCVENSINVISYKGIYNILVYVLILTLQHLIHLPMVEQGGTALVFINVLMCI